MSRLAVRRNRAGAGAVRAVAQTPTPSLPVRTTGMAASDVMNTLASGRAGWTIPQIGEIPRAYVACPGERVAARVAMALLRAGVASAARYQGGALEFVRSAIREFVERNGGPSIRKTFRLHLLLTTTLNEYSNQDDLNPARLYFTLEPSEAGYFVAGPTLSILEREHPRLPATFVQLISGALNQWIRVYDQRDARERIEMLRDWYSADPDGELVELPNVEGSVPASLSERSMRVSELRRLLPSFTPPVQDWMRRAIEIETGSRRRPRPPMTEEIEVDFGDRNPPLPSLLMVFRPADGIEACFDDESQAMMEALPEPNLVIPVDATNPADVRRAFKTLEVVCATLAKAAELIEKLPGATGREQSDGV